MYHTPAQMEALRVWTEAQAAAKEARKKIEHEQAARKAVFAAFLLPQDEGTHREELPEGWQLKYKTPYERKVDKRIVESLRAPLKLLHVSLDRLVEWEPTLVLKEYRELTAEARAVFAACLTTTPGMPTLELVPPKG